MCLFTGWAHRRKVLYLSKTFFMFCISHSFAKQNKKSPLHACLYRYWANSQLNVKKSMYFWELKTILIVHQFCEKCIKTNSLAHVKNSFVKQNTTDNKISCEWTALTHCHFGMFILCLTLKHFCLKSTEHFWLDLH